MTRRLSIKARQKAKKKKRLAWDVLTNAVYDFSLNIYENLAYSKSIQGPLVLSRCDGSSFSRSERNMQEDRERDGGTFFSDREPYSDRMGSVAEEMERERIPEYFVAPISITGEFNKRA